MKKNYLWSMLAMMMVSLLSVSFVSCGGGDDPADEVTASPNSIIFETSGGSRQVQITSNTSWTISGAPSWLTVSPMSGKGNATISISASASSSYESRNAFLSIQAGKASTGISITQGNGSPGGDLAQRASGVYVGKLVSGGEIVSDAYKVTINRLNSTSVEVIANFFDETVNFNVAESQGQIILTNANYSQITMYVTGNTLNISFVNMGGTMTTYVGTKN